MQPDNPQAQTPNTESTAKAQVGECALLRAITVTKAGSFMDCGLERDLLVPVSQQIAPMTEGRFYVVYLLLDPKDQIIGSTKLHRHLDERAKNMAPGDAVDLLIVNHSDMGYKAVVNGTHLGLLYKDEVFEPLKPGDKTKGYIKGIREDCKLDLGLHKQNNQTRSELGERVLAFLKANGGSSTLTDYSPPEEIYRQYKVSKGNYKKTLGALYKQRLISVSKEKISLIIS
jgi:predicted RNA-binding protein (virulence factor B family)